MDDLHMSTNDFATAISILFGKHDLLGATFMIL